MQINKNNIRLWVRKFYKCHWTFNENTISLKCGSEEFHIDASKLDEEDLNILKNIVNYEQFNKEPFNL